MTTLIESPHFELVHDPTYACLYATWQGPHDAPVTQVNYELIFWFVRRTRSTKLLNDCLLDQNGWQQLTSWLTQNCFPRLAQEGLTAVAWVLPRDVQALGDTRKVLALLEQPLVGTFDDPEAAYNWLHQWPKTGNGNPTGTHP